MRCLDAGHSYLVSGYDGGEPQKIEFMKREGEMYPGNVGSHPGTNCQELLRVLIDRVKYLDGQIPYSGDAKIVIRLQECLYIFEERAAERHHCEGMFQVGMGVIGTLDSLEKQPTCARCGHIFCGGHDGAENSL